MDVSNYVYKDMNVLFLHMYVLCIIDTGWIQSCICMYICMGKYTAMDYHYICTCMGMYLSTSEYYVNYICMYVCM